MLRFVVWLTVVNARTGDEEITLPEKNKNMEKSKRNCHM